MGQVLRLRSPLMRGWGEQGAWAGALAWSLWGGEGGQDGSRVQLPWAPTSPETFQNAGV